MQTVFVYSVSPTTCCWASSEESGETKSESEGTLLKAGRKPSWSVSMLLRRPKSATIMEKQKMAMRRMTRDTPRMMVWHFSPLFTVPTVCLQTMRMAWQPHDMLLYCHGTGSVANLSVMTLNAKCNQPSKTSSLPCLKECWHSYKTLHVTLCMLCIASPSQISKWARHL